MESSAIPAAGPNCVRLSPPGDRPICLTRTATLLVEEWAGMRLGTPGADDTTNHEIWSRQSIGRHFSWAHNEQVVSDVLILEMSCSTWKFGVESWEPQDSWFSADMAACFDITVLWFGSNCLGGLPRPLCAIYASYIGPFLRREKQLRELSSPERQHALNAFLTYTVTASVSAVTSWALKMLASFLQGVGWVHLCS